MNWISSPSLRKFVFIYFDYLRKRRRGVGDRTERGFIHCFTPQTPAVAGIWTRPGPNWKQGAPTWVPGIQFLEPSPAVSQALHLQETGTPTHICCHGSLTAKGPPQLFIALQVLCLCTAITMWITLGALGWAVLDSAEFRPAVAAEPCVDPDFSLCQAL